MTFDNLKENTTLMKHFIFFLAISSTFFFTACTGDPGPPGPPGPEGQPGINILGQVFEAQISFNQGNNYQELVVFPSSIEVFESDVVLIYWLEEVVPDGQGGTLDVWSQLPQTIYLQNGSFQYTFNHTFLDALIFLQGDINLGTLGSGFTDDQIFRIAIVPSEFGSADLTMDDLMSSPEVNFFDGELDLD